MRLGSVAHGRFVTLRQVTRVARTVSLFVAAVFAGCSGAAPTQPPPDIPPGPRLPALTSMSIAFSDETPAASLTVAASVVPLDERGQPMSVGLVAWSSSDTTIATIGSDGAILARRAGTTTIGAVVGLVSARRTLTVLPPPPGPLPVVSIAVTPLTSTLGVGESVQLTAVLRDFARTVLTDRTLVWVSGNDSVAVVSDSGIVTARSAGETVIEVISEGRRSGAVITVKAPVDPNISLAIAKPASGAVVGDSVPVLVSVRSVLPLDSVVVVIAGRSTPLQLVLTPNITGTILVPTWEATVDISSAPYGTLALVVTATDSSGRRGVAVTAVLRNPTLTPGSKPPPANR